MLGGFFLALSLLFGRFCLVAQFGINYGSVTIALVKCIGVIWSCIAASVSMAQTACYCNVIAGYILRLNGGGSCIDGGRLPSSTG